MKYLLSSWIFLPALIYFAIVRQYAQDLPQMDDYEVILQFLTNFNHATIVEKITLLFSQYNEHRLLHSRIIYLVYYWITGGIDFRNLIFIGDMQLLVIGAIFAYTIKQTGIKHWKWASFAWMICLFDLNTFESADMAMYGMQNYGVIMLFFLSLFFYSKGRLIPGVIFQSLLIFSSGNGMVGAVFLAIYLLYNGSKDRHKIIAVSAGILCIALYFVGYEFVQQPGKLPFNPLTVFVFFVRNVGAYVDFDASFFFGLCIIVALIWAFPRKEMKRYLAIMCILGFVLGSMGTTALMRSCFTWTQFQASRYLIYPEMLMGITSLLFFFKFRSAKHKWGIVQWIPFTAILLCYGKKFEFGRMGFERTYYKAQTRQYWHPEPQKAAQIAKNACDEGIYCLEDNR